MVKRALFALTPLTSVLMSVSAQAQPAADRPDYWHHGWDWGWGHMIFGSLMMVLFWGGIILAIIFAVRWLGSRPAGEAPSASRNKALEILQERFARGEIDKEEFEARRQLLSD